MVVPDDVGQRRRRAAAQEVEVPTGDLPAVDIRSAVHPEQLDLDRPEARIGQPVAEDPPDEREQVEVAGMRRRSASAHPIAGDEERPVEAAAVVGDQPGVRRDRRGEGVEQRGLLGVIRQEELDLVEPVAGPRPEPDQEGDRPGARGQAGRLGVEADQGTPGGAPSGKRPSRSRSIGKGVDGRSTRT